MSRDGHPGGISCSSRSASRFASALRQAQPPPTKDRARIACSRLRCLHFIAGYAGCAVQAALNLGTQSGRPRKGNERASPVDDEAQRLSRFHFSRMRLSTCSTARYEALDGLNGLLTDRHHVHRPVASTETTKLDGERRRVVLRIAAQPRDGHQNAIGSIGQRSGQARLDSALGPFCIDGRKIIEVAQREEDRHSGRPSRRRQASRQGFGLFHSLIPLGSA